MDAYTLQSKSSGVCFRCPCLKSCSLVYMILHQPTQAELQAKPSPCLEGCYYSWTEAHQCLSRDATPSSSLTSGHSCGDKKHGRHGPIWDCQSFKIKCNTKYVGLCPVKSPETEMPVAGHAIQLTDWKGADRTSRGETCTNPLQKEWHNMTSEWPCNRLEHQTDQVWPTESLESYQLDAQLRFIGIPWRSLQ